MCATCLLACGCAGVEHEMVDDNGEDRVGSVHNGLGVVKGGHEVSNRGT